MREGGAINQGGRRIGRKGSIKTGGTYTDVKENRQNQVIKLVGVALMLLKATPTGNVRGHRAKEGKFVAAFLFGRLPANDVHTYRKTTSSFLVRRQKGPQTYIFLAAKYYITFTDGSYPAVQQNNFVDSVYQESKRPTKKFIIYNECQ